MEGRNHRGAWPTIRLHNTHLCRVLGRKRKALSSLVTSFMAGIPVTKDKLTRERLTYIFNINFIWQVRVKSHNPNKYFSPANVNVERKGHWKNSALPSPLGPRRTCELVLVSKDLYISPAFGHLFFILPAGFGAGEISPPSLYGLQKLKWREGLSQCFQCPWLGLNKNRKGRLTSEKHLCM